MRSFFKFLLFVLLLSAGVAALYNLRRTGSITGDHRELAVEEEGQRVPEKYTPAEGPAIDVGDVNLLAALDAQYTKLAEAVVPSVVSIATSRTVRFRAVDPLAQFFYGRAYGGQAFEQKQDALGSGVIVSREGHVLTNHHVVGGMDEITVILSDGTTHEATVIGTDEDTDLAVLKVDAKGLKPLALGDSDEVKVGQMVFAIGNPFGLEETITQGIVSAVGRRTMSDSANEYIQTDTAINPGNSGGPLINLRGEIIGINNHIFSKSGGYQGISFAIPANIAKRVLESLTTTGRVVRGWLGVSWQPLTPALAEKLGVEDRKGALISLVVPNSPAEAAGLREGDVVRAVNGKGLKDGMDLALRIRTLRSGDKAELRVLRGGAEETLVATIGDMPANPQAAVGPGGAGRSGPGSPSAGVLEGVSVRDVTLAFSQRLGVPANTAGVLVVQVQPGTPAAQVLRPGDIIQEIDRKPVRNVQEYEEEVAALDPSQPVMLFIVRQGAQSFVVVNPN